MLPNPGKINSLSTKFLEFAHPLATLEKVKAVKSRFRPNIRTPLLAQSNKALANFKKMVNYEKRKSEKFIK